MFLRKNDIGWDNSETFEMLTVHGHQHLFPTDEWILEKNNIFWDNSETFEMLTVHGQQHIFPTDEWILLRNNGNFWDRTFLKPREIASLGIHIVWSGHLSYQGEIFPVPYSLKVNLVVLIFRFRRKSFQILIYFRMRKGYYWRKIVFFLSGGNFICRWIFSVQVRLCVGTREWYRIDSRRVIFLWRGRDWNPGACITAAISCCRKPLNQWQCSFQMKAALPLANRLAAASDRNANSGHRRLSRSMRVGLYERYPQGIESPSSYFVLQCRLISRMKQASRRPGEDWRAPT